MKVSVRIQKGELRYTSEAARQMFFQKGEGQDAVLEVIDEPSANMRRFFEGAVVPSVFYNHPFSGWKDFADAREALKIEFLAGYTTDLKGKHIKYPKSTTTLTKEGFKAFLDKILRWLEENGMEVPDSTEYTAWRDSAPPVGEIYPPLARMRTLYEEKKLSASPWKISKLGV